MKWIPMAFLCLASLTPCYAQPSQQQVLKDIQKSWPGAWGVKFDGGPMETNDGAYYTWSQLAVCTTKTALASKYPNALCVVFGAAVYYKLTNGSFQFKEYSVPEGHYGYVGVPGPAEQDILAWIDRNGGKAKVYKDSPSRISKISSFRIIPKFYKDDALKIYAFDVESEYDYVTYASSVVTYKTRYNLEMRKLDDGSWFDHLDVTTEYGYPVTVRERKITKPEEESLLANNIEQQSSDAASQAFLAKLPKVDIPANFETPFHLMVHFMDFLRTADYYKAQSYLYQMMAPRCFVQGSKSQLTPEGQNLMNHVLNVVQNKKIKYSEFFCDDPPMTEYSNDENVKELRFLGKLGNYKSRIQVARNGPGGDWKLYYVEIKFPSTDDEIARIRSANDQTQFCNFTDKQSVKKFVGIVPDPLAKGNAKPKTSAWKSYTSANGNFSIQFPGDVTEKVNPTGKVTYYNYTAPSADGALYAAVSVKLERKLTDAEAATIGQNFFKSFLGSEKLISQGSYKRGQGGIEAMIDQKGMYDVRYVVFIDGEYVYQLYVTSNKNARIEANENQFFSSFGAAASGSLPDKSGGKKDDDDKKDKKKKKK